MKIAMQYTVDWLQVAILRAPLNHGNTPIGRTSQPNGLADGSADEIVPPPPMRAPTKLSTMLNSLSFRQQKPCNL